MTELCLRETSREKHASCFGALLRGTSDEVGVKLLSHINCSYLICQSGLLSLVDFNALSAVIAHNYFFLIFRHNIDE